MTSSRTGVGLFTWSRYLVALAVSHSRRRRVGSVGDALDNDGMARVGTVSRMLLPTDGLWRGAMSSFQDPALLLQIGSGIEESPLLSMASLTSTYLAWTGPWTVIVLGLTAMAFHRRDL
ncbi:MAG TPA: hypothetical protein VFB84_22445 [Micromonosporaceae bacterium]|nr:hypothetical protein [Micromonosporaceae bacterium]